MPWECNQSGRGPTGHTGKSGKSQNEKSPNGLIGEIGEITRTHINNPKQLGGYSLTFIKMLIHEAELDYLNNRIHEAFHKLTWIEKLLSSGTIIRQESIDLTVEFKEFTNEIYVNTLLEKVQSLLIQISQGLDYYGNYANYIPLTSIKIYEVSIEKMLLLAKDVEISYNIYYSNQQSALKKRKAIQNTTDLIVLQKEDLTLNKEQLILEIHQGKEQISSMLEELIVLEIKIKNAKEEFENAVSREAACGLSEVIKAASAIAMIASGVGTLAGGAAMLAETNNYIQQQEVKKRFKKGKDYIVKHAKVVKKGIDGISEGYHSIKSILDQERDGAKIITAEEDFEAAVKKFEHLPEAREYRRIMRQFLSLTKMRNNKILEIDAKTTRVYEIEIESDELDLDIQSTQSRLLTVFNPKLAEHIVFFENAIKRTKSSILRAIVMEHKALKYWGLTSVLIPVNLQDKTIAQLNSLHLSFKEKYLRLIEERNAVPQSINPPKIQFLREKQEDIYHVFDRIGRFSFEVTPSHPSYRYYSRVLVNNAEISIETSTPINGWSWCFLRHNGNSIIVDQTGNHHSFSHRKRDRVAQLAPGETKLNLTLGGEIGKYAFLSPFANWSFMMEFTDKEGSVLKGEAEKLARKNIKSISIRFKGIADARYGNNIVTYNEKDSIEFEPMGIFYS